MKKLSFAAAAALMMVSGSAFAADLAPKMYTKAAPPVVASPWDFAFGDALMSDYIFRGVTQSNHKPSVAAYFEPRYNINPNLQLYAGVSGESISFANRAAAEIDGYFGIRPTFGPLALDFGFWEYYYPGGQCFWGGVGQNPSACGNNADFGALPINGNVAKADASFYEVYGKATYTFNDYFALGGAGYYSPNFLNTGANGTYGEINAKFTAPSTMLPYGIGAYLSGAFGRQWLGTSDAFYGTNFAAGIGSIYQFGIKEPSYNTWNVGIGFTKSVFTLDLRYSDTDLSKGACNAFTSDFSTGNRSAAYVSAINPGNQAQAFGSNWCGSTFTAKLSADLTAMSNLK